MSASFTRDHFLFLPEINLALATKQQSFKISHNWSRWSVEAPNCTASIHATLGTSDFEDGGFCRKDLLKQTLHIPYEFNLIHRSLNMSLKDHLKHHTNQLGISDQKVKDCI